MGGMALVNAATLIAELGDLSRFAKSAPADGLSRAGAVRTFERRQRQTRRHHQACPWRRTGGGNGAARRLLIEAAWCYRFPARVGRELLLRQEEQPRPIRAIAWKAQLRLCARYRRLARAGKPANIVTTAIAPELSGFVWAIARQVMATAG